MVYALALQLKNKHKEESDSKELQYRADKARLSFVYIFLVAHRGQQQQGKVKGTSYFGKQLLQSNNIWESVSVAGGMVS